MSEYICGRWAVEEALRQEKSRVSKVFLSAKLKGPVADEIENLSRQRGVSVVRIPENELDRRYQGQTHRGSPPR